MHGYAFEIVMALDVVLIASHNPCGLLYVSELPVASMTQGLPNASAGTNNGLGYTHYTSTPLTSPPLLVTSAQSPLAGTTISIPGGASSVAAHQRHQQQISETTQLLLPSFYASQTAAAAQALMTSSGLNMPISSSSYVTQRTGGGGGGGNPALAVTMVPSPSSSTGSNSQSQYATHQYGNNQSLRSDGNSIATTLSSPPSNQASSSSHDNNNMELSESLSNALNDLPLLDMDWASSDMSGGAGGGHSFLGSPSVNMMANSFDFIHDVVDSKKDVNLFTPPLSGADGGVSQSLSGADGGVSQSLSGADGGVSQSLSGADGGGVSQSLLFSPAHLKFENTAASVNSRHDDGSGDGSGIVGSSTLSDNTISMEVSDWLETLMPGSCGGPSTPSSSGADPIMTPKAQDVLDLFDMTDDLYSNSDGIMGNFDKALEAATK